MSKEEVKEKVIKGTSMSSGKGKAKGKIGGERKKLR